MKKQTLIIILLVAMFAVAALIWSRRNVIGVPAAQGSDLALIVDNSTSQNVDCDEVAALAGSGLDELTIGKSSHLFVYTLGTDENAYEPMPRLDIPLERGSGGKRKAMRQVAKACSSFGTVDSSSIFRAVEVALDQLQTRGLSGSRLILRSDLGENVDRRLAYKYTKKNALLRNAGIEILVCGVAMTNEGGGPRGARADALEKTWRAAFATPSEVTIEPFCPGQHASETASR
jgi:hypothetical protein